MRLVHPLASVSFSLALAFGLFDTLTCASRCTAGEGTVRASAVKEDAAQEDAVKEVRGVGSIVSTKAADLRCEISGRGDEQPTISKIYVVEGEVVKEGDVVFSLESGYLEEEMNHARVRVETASADVRKARIGIEVAEAALVEYSEGMAQILEKELRLEVLDAEGDLLTAISELETLKETGGSSAAIQAAEYQVKRSEANLDLAKTKVKVFEEFTKRRTLTELEGDIERAQAELAAAEQSLESHQVELQRASVFLRRSVVDAPMTGIVQIMGTPSGRSGGRIGFREGSKVREGQTIVRILDPEELELVITVDETNITEIEAGQKVSLTVDAYPEETIKGEVVSIGPIPNASAWTRGGTRKYGVNIKFIDNELTLKPGMTAEAVISTD